MANPYLLVYNTVLAAGWAFVLYLTFATVAAGGWTKEVLKAVDLPLKVVQTAAIAEVAHSLLGVVKSPFFTTFIQVASRIWALWGIVNVAPAACGGGAVSLFKVGPLHAQLNLITLLFCWCVSEVLRYSFYACKELNIMPYPLLWLRYSAFIVLYPLGVASEMAMVYLAMPTIKKNRPLSIFMPNAWNFALDYYVGCWLGVACYVPGLPELYLHMVKQRKKVLSDGAGGAGAGPSGSGARGKAKAT